jgi:tetratricopeptide (TPR) repeat protein
VTDPTSSILSSPDEARDDQSRAIEEARTAVAADPKSESAAKRLAKLIRARPKESFEEPDPLSGAAQAVRHADALLKEGKEEEAEILLRRHLAQHRNDPPAMLVMAQIASQCGFPENAEKILRRSLEIDPTRTENRVALARVLHGIALSQDRYSLVAELIEQLEEALRREPDHWDALALRASILVQIRRLDGAQAMFERMLELRPESSFVWRNFGQLLNTRGDFGGSVAAYRTAVALDPENGAAWWGLANLKTFRFFPSDIREMEDSLRRGLPDKARVPIHLALATAYDGLKDYESAATHLRLGNELRLRLEPHHVDEVRKGTDQAIHTFTRQFFAERAGRGNPSREPIFIVGMPRSGSTLIEQILSSHSMIEGTEELFAMHQIDGELQRAHPGLHADLAIVATDVNDLNALGERYLHLSGYHRKTDRPYFTDKNPANWRYIGLIHAILPNARIIDARRDPMDCCFANLRQHYQWGVNFAYGQAEVAHQYREYVRLMRHFDDVIPGVIHRVIHDDLVDDFEQEVRRLLDYLGLPFEEGCLRFHENKRAVHTPSAEQVRQPINRSGFGRWRNYEPWLGDLKNSLGDTLQDWRD